MRIRVIMLLLLSSATAYGADAYKCTVIEAKDLNANGVYAVSNWAKMYVGREFTVDRGTGRTTGGLTNHNAYGQPQVLDHGSRDQAFKAITIYRPAISVDYVYVKEYADSVKKPFYFLSGTVLASGLCEPY